jgi:hypothetical protein
MDTLVGQARLVSEMRADEAFALAIACWRGSTPPNGDDTTGEGAIGHD